MTKPDDSSYRVSDLCQALGVSRQAYYQHQQRQATVHYQEDMIIQLVATIRARQPMIGGRKLYFLLQSRFQHLDFKLGRDQFFAILRQHDLLVKQRRYRCRTTDSNHPYRRYPSLTDDLTVNRIHQLFVADITYLGTLEGFVYLALITDAFSRKIMGYDLSESLSADGSLRALHMALKPIRTTDNLTHHSDRGIQYCCHAYIDRLRKDNIRISMTENGDPYENAMAERVNGILKIDFLLGHTFSTKTNAINTAKESIIIYNQERPHLSLNYQTPDQVYQESYQILRT